MSLLEDLFNFVSKKRSLAQKAQQSQAIQAFILEPILTPSGLVDDPTHGADAIIIDPNLGIDPSLDFPPDAHPGLDHAPDVDVHLSTETILPEHIESFPFIDDPEPAIPGVEDLFNSGIFTVGESGKVSIDYLFDGGGYQGQLAIFNLDGMEQYDISTPDGLNAFIHEAATRSLSNSDLGHVVIADATEGAKFSGMMPSEWENHNFGEYQGVKTFDMHQGDRFAVMLVPNGTVEQVLDGNQDADIRPLFSLHTVNPNEAFHAGQIADVTGDGNTFVLEDLRTDHTTDRDYNDIIFQVRGATGTAAHLDDVINPELDWRGTDLGQALIEYAKPYITPEQPIVSPVHNFEPVITQGGAFDDPRWGTIWPGIDHQGEIDGAIAPNHNFTDLPLVAHPSEIANSNLPNGEVRFDFPQEHQPLVGEINHDGVGIDISDKAPLWVNNADDSGNWAVSLTKFVDAAKTSGQPNAIFNLNFDLTEIKADGSIVPRYELTALEREALIYAQQYDVLLVVAAGNESGQMSALGQASLEFDNIITVGAAERVNDSVALSKAFDLADYSGSGYALDILAPGSIAETPITETSENVIGKVFGTSVATTKVSSAASQVWAANPDLSYRQVIDILKRTATDLQTPNWDSETGAGLLNLAAAVHLAKVTPAIDVDVPVRFDFKKTDQPLVGVIDTGFNGKNPDIDYSRVTLGRDRVDNDSNPLLEEGKGSEHGTHVLGIIAATQRNGIGIDGMNDDAPLWLGRAIGSGKWAESLREFVDAAKASGQPNAVVNLSFDLTQINADGSVTTRYELTPQEREALEYARQNKVMVVVAAGNDGGTMSALGQASQEFDNIITVGSINNNGDRAKYSSYGNGLDFVARGGTADRPVISTVGEGDDLKLLTSDEEPPEDEMSAIAKTTFEEVFGSLSDAEESEIDAQALENLTPEERQVYDEATKEIDQLLNDYLGAASQKVALEYADGYYAASVDVLSQFVDTFDEDLADNLIKAQEVLGNAGFSSNISTPTNLDFSIPLDLGIGEMAGTSVAAAKVTGAVSQVWAANPRLSYPQVKEILKQTAVDLNTPGWDAATGSGLVNVAAAVELAKHTQPQAYQPKPIQSPLTWSGEGKVTPGERAVSVSVPTFTGRLMNAGYVTQTGWLRIRSGPGTNYGEVGRKYPGDAISFDAYENNGGWVPDPSMPGGGSSRWYKIAGTNNWMSALYIDNTPERAEQERQQQDAIRRAEEEARRAEDEARRAEEEARRAEEELQKILEEQRRKQEQLQTVVSQISQKVGDLGVQLGGYLNNDVSVYQFAKGTLLIQPDGRSAFYEVGNKVTEFLDPNKQGSFGNYIWNPSNPWGVNIANNASRLIDNADRLEQLGKFLAYPGFSNSMNGFVLNPPRFGNYSKYIDDSFSFFNSHLNKWDELIDGKTFTNPGKNGFVFKTPGVLPKGISGLAKSGVIGSVLGLIPTAWEYSQAKTDEERGKALIKGGAGTLGGMVGGYVGAALFAPILPPAGAIVGGIAGGLVGGYIGELAGEWVSNNWQPITQSLQDGWNAATSAVNNSIEAAKAKAQAAAEKAKELAQKAKAAYQTATATVQQAKAAYQTFKTEVQKATTQIVQQSQQKIKEEAQKIYNKVIQSPVVQTASKVVKYVANYANKAAKVVGNIINGAKQFVSNVIDSGKKFVSNVIDSGKKAYQEVKNFVSNTYETGKKVVAETYNKAAEAVNNVTNTISNGFNSVKSLFSFGW